MQSKLKVSKAFFMVSLGILLSGCTSTYYYSSEPTSTKSTNSAELSKSEKPNQVNIDGAIYSLSHTYFAASGERCGTGQNIPQAEVTNTVVLCANPQTGVWRVIPSVLTKFGT